MIRSWAVARPSSRRRCWVVASPVATSIRSVVFSRRRASIRRRSSKSPGGWLGPEYQVLDDAGHPNGKVEDTTAASLYEVVPAAKDKALNPVGEWNQSRIVAKGTTLEHWLNGKLAVKIDTAGGEWPELKKASKFAKMEGFAGPAAGHLLLQDHGDPVWFRAIRIREL